MIHTDGRPTIANHPGVPAEPVKVIEAALLGVSLLEREYAGLTVEVLWDGFTDQVTLAVRRGDEQHAVVIPRDKVQDAFEHPYVYLSRAGVNFDPR